MRKSYRGAPPTLALVLEQGTTVIARCERRTCMHGAELDVAALAQQLGGDCTGPRGGVHPIAAARVSIVE